MTRRTDTLPATYFDALYRDQSDPWGFRTRRYEAEKYERTLAALSRDRYETALEVGCSIGVFTAKLAPRCDALLAIDGSAVALRTALHACGTLPHLQFEQRMVPDEFPAGTFSLILLSEVLYYLQARDLDRLADLCVSAQSEGGEMMLCHWLGETDYPMTGADATERFASAVVPHGYTRRVLHDDTYRLERLTRP